MCDTTITLIYYLNILQSKSDLIRVMTIVRSTFVISVDLVLHFRNIKHIFPEIKQEKAS